MISEHGTTILQVCHCVNEHSARILAITVVPVRWEIRNLDSSKVHFDGRRCQVVLRASGLDYSRHKRVKQ